MQGGVILTSGTLKTKPNQSESLSRFQMVLIRAGFSWCWKSWKFSNRVGIRIMNYFNIQIVVSCLFAECSVIWMESANF